MSSLPWLTGRKFAPRSGSMKYIAIGICNTQQFGNLPLTKVCVLSVYSEGISGTPPATAPTPSGRKKKKTKPQWSQRRLERLKENLLESHCTRNTLTASFPSSNALWHFSRQRYFFNPPVKSVSWLQWFCPAVLQKLIWKKNNIYKIDCPRANRSAWIIIISLVLKCPLSNVHPVYHINNTFSNKLIDKLIIDLAATPRSSAGFAWRRAAVDEPCWRRQRTPRHPGNDPWITSSNTNSKIRCSKEVMMNGGAQDLSNPMSATV